MFPDLPELKQELNRIFDRLLSILHNRYLGVLGEIPRSRVHEGRRLEIQRADGSNDVTDMKQASADFRIATQEVPDLTPRKVAVLLDDVAKKMAEEVSKIAFTQINEGVEKAGNVVDGRGQRLNFDLLYEVIDKIAMDFDEHGNPSGMRMIVGAEMFARLRELDAEMNSNPAVKQRFDDLMQKKREEWRAREASRKLVG